MALELTSPDEIQEILQRIKSIEMSIEGVLKTLRESKMHAILLHKRKLLSLDLPNVEEWVDALGKTARAQVRSFKSGVQSAAQINKNKIIKRKAKQQKNEGE